MSEGSQDAMGSAPEKAILSYASGNTRSAEKLVTAGRYPNDAVASMHAARLAEEGIFSKILNANVNALGAPYSGFADVELQVRESALSRARWFLAESLGDLEPVDEPAPAPLDDQGQLIPLAEAGAYASVRELREAMAVLASAQLHYFPPALAPRGDRPPGEGRRFILRVHEDDLPAAGRLLEEAAAAAEAEADARCPKCRSYRVCPVPQFWKSFRAFWGMGPAPQKQMECLACHYRGTPREFEHPDG